MEKVLQPLNEKAASIIAEHIGEEALHTHSTAGHTSALLPSLLCTHATTASAGPPTLLLLLFCGCACRLARCSAGCA
jgi:hypothetical protein